MPAPTSAGRTLATVKKAGLQFTVTLENTGPRGAYPEVVIRDANGKHIGSYSSTILSASKLQREEEP